MSQQAPSNELPSATRHHKFGNREGIGEGVNHPNMLGSGGLGVMCVGLNIELTQPSISETCACMV